MWQGEIGRHLGWRCIYFVLSWYDAFLCFADGTSELLLWKLILPSHAGLLTQAWGSSISAQTLLHAADIPGRDFSEKNTCISVAAGSRKKTREPMTSICIRREQFSQAQSLSSGNTSLLLHLEVYEGTVVRASMEGTHCFYDSWKEGFVLMDRPDIAFDFLAASLCTDKPSVLREAAFVPRRAHSTNSATPKPAFASSLPLCPPQNTHTC